MTKSNNSISKLIGVLILVIAIVFTFSVDNADAATKKIGLKYKSAYIAVEDTYTVKLLNTDGKTISPSKIKWTTNKESVATVSSKGVVKAKKAGTAKITAQYNGKKYTFTAKVKNPYIKLESQNFIVGVDSTAKLALTSEKSIKASKVDWEVDDDTIVMVDGDGVISAVGTGTTVITATYKNNTFEKTITVVEPILKNDSLTVEVETSVKQELLAVSEDGKTYNWGKNGNVEWYSSDDSVATVEAGVINGNAIGTAEITAVINEVPYSSVVTVVPKVELNKKNASIDKDETIQLSVTGISDSVTWSSDKKSVATVDNNGLVTGKGHGTATITAKVNGKTLTCKVKVTAPILYTNKDTVTMDMNGSSSVKVTFRDSGSVYYDIEDDDVVTCAWSKKWDGNTTKLNLYAQEPGTTYVTITNSEDNTKAKIKVIVESEVKISLPSTPITVNEYGYKNKMESSCKVTNIYYTVKYYSHDDNYTVELYFDGIKLYDENGSGQSAACSIGWKLYNENGAVIESDTAYSSAIAEGESFVGAHDYIFDLKKGNYTLKILDVN